MTTRRTSLDALMFGVRYIINHLGVSLPEYPTIRVNSPLQATEDSASNEIDLSVSSAVRVRQATVTFDDGDLTSDTNSQAFTLSPSLPAGSAVLGVAIDLGTVLDDAEATITMDIGPSGDTDAIIDGADLTTAANGQAGSRPLGVAPNLYVGSETALSATVTSTGTISDISQGDCTVRVFYAEIG